MEAVITGDLIYSKKVNEAEWLPLLKNTLSLIGEGPGSWDIFRGDSFQFQVTDDKALWAAILVRASIKRFPPLDARLAMGLGKITYEADSVAESNGEAFYYSGQKFDTLKKKNLVIKSPWPELDDELNLYFDLLERIIGSWSANSAEIMFLSLTQPDVTQADLAQMLKISQGNVSERLKRAGYKEVMKVNERYELLIKKYWPDGYTN